MKVFIGLILLFYSFSAFSSPQQVRVICKNFAQEVRADFRLEFSEALFATEAARAAKFIVHRYFDPRAYANQVKVVTSAGFGSFGIEIREERLFSNSRAVSGYQLEVWLFEEEGLKGEPLVIYLKSAFLVLSGMNNEKSVLGAVVVGRESNDRSAVLYGSMLDFRTNEQELLLCRLLP